MKALSRYFVRALMITGALVAMNMPPLVSSANAQAIKCNVTIDPGQVCTVSTSCFLGYCHGVVVCCC